MKGHDPAGFSFPPGGKLLSDARCELVGQKTGLDDGPCWTGLPMVAVNEPRTDPTLTHPHTPSDSLTHAIKSRIKAFFFFFLIVHLACCTLVLNFSRI